MGSYACHIPYDAHPPPSSQNLAEMHEYMTNCQYRIAEKRKQGVDCDIPKFDKGDRVAVLANRATRKAKNLHVPYALEATIRGVHKSNDQWYKVTWKTRGISGEAPGTVSKRSVPNRRPVHDLIIPYCIVGTTMRCN